MPEDPETTETSAAVYRCNRCGELMLMDPRYEDASANTFGKQHRHSGIFGPPNIKYLGLNRLTPSQ
jgi:hypothetical protein